MHDTRDIVRVFLPKAPRHRRPVILVTVFDTALETCLHKHPVIPCMLLSVRVLRWLDDEILAIVSRPTGVVATLAQHIRELYLGSALGRHLLFGVVAHVRSGMASRRR